MCSVLRVSRSGFYRWLRRQNQFTERQIENVILGRRIEEIFKLHRQRYGAVRIRKELMKEGVKVSIKRVNWHLKSKGLVCVHTKRFKVATTNSKHSFAVAENTLNREFSPSQPNEVWATDITYIKTMSGWVYLAVILDLCHRKVVGYKVGTKLDSQLVIAALDAALKRCRPSKGLLIHSDRGVQFASHDFRAVLRAATFTQSMSRRGNCWDNAPVESFFATLKKELIYPLGEVTNFQVERELFEYIEAYYNSIRAHSFLDYLSPLEFEKLKIAA
jgi:putative transposase